MLIYRSTGVGVGVFGLVFACALTTFLLTDLNKHEAVKVLPAIVFVFSGIALFIFLMVAIFDKTSEETKVENELKVELVKKSKD